VNRKLLGERESNQKSPLQTLLRTLSTSHTQTCHTHTQNTQKCWQPETAAGSQKTPCAIHHKPPRRHPGGRLTGDEDVLAQGRGQGHLPDVPGTPGVPALGSVARRERPPVRGCRRRGSALSGHHIRTPRPWRRRPVGRVPILARPPSGPRGGALAHFCRSQNPFFDNTRCHSASIVAPVPRKLLNTNSFQEGHPQ
jgi:hypothetical protein